MKQSHTKLGPDYGQRGFLGQDRRRPKRPSLGYEGGHRGKFSERVTGAPFYPQLAEDPGRTGKGLSDWSRRIGMGQHRRMAVQVDPNQSAWIRHGSGRERITLPSIVMGRPM